MKGPGQAPRGAGGPSPTNRHAWAPPINKLTLLKTAVFVFKFKLCPPPPDKRLAPPSQLLCRRLWKGHSQFQALDCCEEYRLVDFLVVGNLVFFSRNRFAHAQLLGSICMSNCVCYCFTSIRDVQFIAID